MSLAFPEGAIPVLPHLHRYYGQLPLGNTVELLVPVLEGSVLIGNEDKSVPKETLLITTDQDRVTTVTRADGTDIRVASIDRESSRTHGALNSIRLPILGHPVTALRYQAREETRKIQWYAYAQPEQLTVLDMQGFMTLADRIGDFALSKVAHKNRDQRRRRNA